MPQVPYSPVPSVAAQGTTLPQVRSSAPLEAFGSEVASAISSAGKTAAGVGDALFERALFLQKQNNDAEARNADSDYIIRSGDLHAKFNSLEGDQAIKAYPEYVKNLKALRESIKGSLSTTDSQRAFDQSSLGQMSRSMFAASSHLSAQSKQYALNSFDAHQQALREEAAANPENQSLIDRNVQRTEQSVREKGRLQGQPPEMIENNVQAAKSSIYASQIESTAKENPLQGPEMLSRMRNKLTEKDFKRVENVVNNQRDAYGSSKIASDLIAAHTDEDGNLTAPMSELQQKARGLAKAFSPDDPAFETKTVRALQTEWNQGKYARKIENFDNRQIVNDAILDGAGSMDQLLMNPKASAAYYALPKSEQLQIPARIDNYIKARDRQYNEQSFTKLMGLSNNDIESFLNTDPSDEKYKLSQSQIRQVQERQAKLKRSTAQDPRVDRAMSWMRGAFGAQMEAMGIRNRTQRNKEDYDHLTGAVQQALDIYMQDNKKPITQTEFNEKIAPQLLKVIPGQTWGDFFFGPPGIRDDTAPKSLFKHDTSSKEYQAFVDNAKKEIAARGGAEPHDEELYKAFTRMQLLKLYPPKGKGATSE